MPDQELLQAIDLVLKTVISLLGAFVSFLVYIHYRQQRKDSWLRDFRALHKSFWDDEAMADVRAWLANDQAYKTITPILDTRKKVYYGKVSPEEISREDYVVLEKLDKFCNLMTSVKVLDPSFADHKVLWERLFVEYWVDRNRFQPLILIVCKESPFTSLIWRTIALIAGSETYREANWEPENPEM